MKLHSLLRDVPTLQVRGDTAREIHQIQFDSRKVTDGALFVALRGTQVDGHEFIDKAEKNGAAVIVAERLPEYLNPQVTYLQVASSGWALGQMASNFYGRPSEKLYLVGVTGTNGKTTTVNLLYDLFEDLGYKCGLVSTVGNKIAGEATPATHTTPDALAANELLAQMVEEQCDYVFMEVSSHAVHQQRIAGLRFTGAIFTNITHDHLDYHGSFRNYLLAKKAFFDQLPPSAFALTNADDRNGEVMVQNTGARIYRYGLRKMADFKASLLDNALEGLHLEIGQTEFFGRLIGEFNAYNLLAVYAAACLLEQDSMEVLTHLSRLKAAEGRFDTVMAPGGTVTGIVDYAHSPDALEKVLATLHKLRKGNTRILTVVGCGGDRDRSKRPEMARVAAAYSDQLILTSDNPRTEDPAAIIREMVEGVPPDQKSKVLENPARREAIRTACRLANAGDVVLIAGKGHEKYQEIQGEKLPFDDKEELRKAFAER